MQQQKTLKKNMKRKINVKHVTQGLFQKNIQKMQKT